MNDRVGDRSSRVYEPPARAKKPAAPADNRFWDGFQWVERVPTVVPLDTTNAADITKAVGLPKDRRIYVGNLPDNADAETLKQFCKWMLRW